MDNFLKLPDEKRPARQARRGKVTTHRDVTTERIEKLKKSFQPFWMRGMILHNQEADEKPGGMTTLNQI
ncbi:MAG: hypothetical protein JSV10_03180 [Candidatus Zixiibacteriota bacterium]|nr:MAG: hypothetical protein JSV10_03180 [candidate division Zixibacteria bacterium]